MISASFYKNEDLHDKTEILTEKAPRIGLKLNVRKCKMVD